MENYKKDEFTSKLLFVLRKITESNNLDNTYLEKLLTNIRSEFRNNHETFLHLPELWYWLSDTLRMWKTKQPSICEADFICQFIGILSTNELGFQLLQKENSVNDVIIMLQLDVLENSTLKILLIRLLSDVLNHESGFQWIIASQQWKVVLPLYFSNSNMYIEREGLLFVKKLIHKAKYNDKINECILQDILTPLRKNIDGDIKSKTFYSDMLLTIRLLKEILQVDMVSENTFLYLKLEKLFNIEAFLKSQIENCEHEALLDVMLELYVLVLIIKFDEKRQLLTVEHIPSVILDVFFSLLNRNQTHSVIKLAKYCQMLWTEMRNKFKCETKIGVHFIIIQLIPMLLYRKPPDSWVYDLFVQKLFSLTSSSTHKLGYSFRDVIKGKTNTRPKYLALKSVLSVMRNIEDLNLNEAVLIFQTMAYGLKAFVPGIGCDRETSNDGNDDTEPRLYLEDASLLSAVLNSLCILIEKFKINWTESLESLCLVKLTCGLLQNPDLCTVAAVQSLLLMKLAIINFMPPDQALLLNNTEDSSFECITSLLYKRMHDPNWEIRDSCLEVITAIAELAETKYPAFQQFLTEKDFCSLVFGMVEGDAESYVRASAIRALTAMIKIESLNQNLEKLDLPSNIIKLLETESEGIVRREAVLLITQIYISLDARNDELLNTLYGVMGYTAICDLHWEVKLNSLFFWEAVIRNTVADQGMIDGSFPKVTFSKEHKKIVNLTQDEVKLRLDKVLEKLSKVGCLFVLVSTLNDDCDMPVIKKSAEILTEFVNILKRYEVVKSCEELPSCDRISMKRKNTNLNNCEKRKTVNLTSREVGQNESTEDHDNHRSSNSDAVIEEIVSEMDINLLVSVYNQKEATKAPGKKSMIQELKPEAFLLHMEGFESEKFLEDKEKWLTNVEVDLKSLLNDIMVSSTDDTNLKDCY